MAEPTDNYSLNLMRAHKTVFLPWVSKQSLFRGILITFLFAFSVAQSKAAVDNKGTEFWIADPGSYVSSGSSELQIVYITADISTTGVVEVPGIGFFSAFSVSPALATPVTIDNAASLGTVSGSIQNKGIHITALDDISVVMLNSNLGATDSLLALPVDALGVEHVIMSYPTSSYALSVSGSTLTLVATEDQTEVCITLTEDTSPGVAWIPFTITLDTGQVYQLMNTGTVGLDLTGTIIRSTKPIAVFGSNRCGTVTITNSACDYFVEQIPPTSLWGSETALMPFQTRTGYVVRVIAKEDATTIDINGSFAALLNRAQIYETTLAGPSYVTANRPILVAQYAFGGSVDLAQADPTMMISQMMDQYSVDYKASTMERVARHYANIVVPDVDVGTVSLDGVSIPAGNYVSIASSGYSGAQTQLAPGTHVWQGANAFGLALYGFNGLADPPIGPSWAAHAYSHPGGFSFASSPITAARNFDVTPSSETLGVGGSGCVMVTLIDPSGGPVSGISVAYTVTGVNPNSGTEVTDGSGAVNICYTGANSGGDTISFSSCEIQGQASKSWVLSPTVTPTYTSTPTPSYTMTITPTASPTSTRTQTFTHTLSATISPTFTITQSISPTPTITITATITPTFTPTPLVGIHVWPIPFNPDTAFGGVLKIETIPDDSTFSIFTVSGELVREIIPINGRAEWDGRNRSGRTVSAGSYYYLVQVGKETLKAGKIVVVR